MRSIGKALKIVSRAPPRGNRETIDVFIDPSLVGGRGSKSKKSVMEKLTTIAGSATGICKYAHGCMNDATSSCCDCKKIVNCDAHMTHHIDHSGRNRYKCPTCEEANSSAPPPRSDSPEFL